VDSQPESLLSRTQAVDRPPPLQEPWPKFLCLLDTDPDEAKQLLWDFTFRFFRAQPPQELFELPAHDREDIPSGIYARCCENNFRRLRTYTNQGKPFAGWLFIMSRNHIRDTLKWHRHAIPILEPENGEDRKDGKKNGYVIPPKNPTQEKEVGEREEQGRIKRCLGRLSAFARFLVNSRLDGLKPRQVVTLLRMPPEANVEISNTTRYYFGIFLRCLQEDGVQDLATRGEA